MTVSEATMPAVDANAGQSTMCRRGEHRFCASAAARCACPCHKNKARRPAAGPNPSSVSDPAPQGDAAAPAANHEPVGGAEPAVDDVGLACDHCDRTYKHRYWLARHLSREHNIDLGAPVSPGERSEQPQPAAHHGAEAEAVSPAALDPHPEPSLWVVVVADLAGPAPAAHAAVFSTPSDAAQAAALLRNVGQHARAFAFGGA